MQLSHDEAKLLAGFILDDFERERLKTLTVVEAIPAGKENYSPDAKSMSAIQLAFHLVASEWGLLETIYEGTPTPPPQMPESVHSARDIAEWETSRLPAQIIKVKSLSGEALARIITFGPDNKFPAYAVLQLMLKHTVHHRGQLSAYLRPMGAAVPSIYGSSADSKKTVS